VTTGARSRIERTKEAVALPATFEAVAVKVVEAKVTVGVPLTEQVVVLRLTPFGSAGEIEQNVGDPPD
jgi:hypothetical protein